MVTRYEEAGEGHVGPCMVEHRNGDYVLYSEHLAIVDKLTKEREYAIRWANKAVEDVRASYEIAKLDAGAEAIRAAYEQGWQDSIAEPRPFAAAKKSSAARHLNALEGGE